MVEKVLTVHLPSPRASAHSGPRPRRVRQPCISYLQSEKYGIFYSLGTRVTISALRGCKTLLVEFDSGGVMIA